MISRPGPIVVVGGGTAGCTVVSHLAAHTPREIVVIEPGPLSAHDDSPGFLDAVADAGLVRSRPVRVSAGRGFETAYQEARALGGGSAVNAMLLTGDAPAELEGLTRVARPDEAGPLGRALMESGGELARMWWNGGRWNPGRAVAHLVDEGRVGWARGEATSLTVRGNEVLIGTDAGEIRASDVVLCAGAIATPALLLASGLGSVNPAIGDGLQNHPMVTFTMHLGEPGEPAGVFDACVIHRGRSVTGAPVVTISYERASRDEANLGLLSSVLLGVESHGSISLEDGRVIVDFNCLATPGDLAAMTWACRRLIERASSPPFAAATRSVSVDAMGTPLSALAPLGDGALADWVLSNAGVASHATGSCAAAVDGVGRLRHVPGVWIADASVIGDSPPCTPAAPVTMVARRTARVIQRSLS